MNNSKKEELEVKTTKKSGFITTTITMDYLHIEDMNKHYINHLVEKVYQQNVEAGWHSKPREIGTCLMLIVSEIAEAMEGDRKSLMDDHLPHRSMLEVELADAVIRIMDLSGREGLDLGGAIVEKLEYNRTRADHKLENRERKGGKKY